MNVAGTTLGFALVGLLAGCLSAPTAREAKPLAVIRSDASLHDKAHACQELAVVGGRASVPALAALLQDERLADYARSGLEAIPHRSAGQALRRALPTLEGRRLAGVVNSLGVRRDSDAVVELRQLALEPTRGVAGEALAALGLIGTPKAADALRHVLAQGRVELRPAAADAALEAAARLAREGNPHAARDLLETVSRVLPPGHLATAAQTQAAALPAPR